MFAVLTHARRQVVLAVLVFAILITGCSAGTGPNDTDVQTNKQESANQAVEAEMLMLPELQAIELGGQKLKVVATTSIVGDVVSQVGGDAIALTTLMGPGQDPHSYQPAARDLTAVAEADIIFVNGWDLEEALVPDLAEIGKEVPVVAISANIVPLIFSEGTSGEVDHSHGKVDPHVWLNISNVKQWTTNVAQAFTALDPANAETFRTNAAAYQIDLETLANYADSQLAAIPEEDRFLVTNHDSLGYFEEAYGFTSVDTILPAASTLAEPSANNLAELINEMEAVGLCTIFTETTVNEKLAQTVAGELTHCDQVKILSLYTGALGPSGSGTDSYIGMFRANVDTIKNGLSQGN